MPCRTFFIAVSESPRFAARDIKVAALSAFGLTPVDVEPSIPPAPPGSERGPNARHVVSRRSQVGYLLDYLSARKRDAPDRIVRAHAPTALARLLVGAQTEPNKPAIDSFLEGFGNAVITKA